ARVTRSTCVLAHVRAATPGLTVSELDCHPFTRGRFTFMHNGDVGGFSHIRRAIQQRLSDRAYAAIQGSTDSVHLFALFLDHVWHCNIADPLEAMASSLLRAVRDVQALQEAHHLKDFNYLNVAISDGVQSVALRYTTDEPKNASSLYVHTGRKYVCDGNICRMVDPEKGQGAALVSSEPLSDDPGWQTVPVNHLVRIAADHSVTIADAVVP
ncbi:MAG: class II glutamine amidotransferase, partial [Phycisphaerae bacterium]|nr:class II glutamine amidotransferase [Phycisphaerae bacterium]